MFFRNQDQEDLVKKLKELEERVDGLSNCVNGVHFYGFEEPWMDKHGNQLTNAKKVCKYCNHEIELIELQR
jgi:hypothetical protein